MSKRARALACTLALTAVLPLASGCLGHFGLVKKTYEYQQNSHPDKWGREGIFLVTSLAYPFCIALDALFFNAVEFFTGDRLIADDGIPSGYVAVATEEGSGAPR